MPNDANDINLVDYEADGVVVTAAEHGQILMPLIDEDESLSSRRGMYAEKNGSKRP